MLSQFKIGPRLIIGFVMVILLFAAAVVPISLSKISELIELSEQSELHNLHKSALAEVSSEGRTAYAIATTMANSAQAQQAMKDNDRARLSDTVSPIYAQLKSKFDVRQLQFHTPPATSFFRAHKPEKFGDDLSSFRKTVVKVNQSKQSVVGLERGVAGLGIRGIAPVEYEERHIGSVEAGMSFGQPFFDQFKKKYNVDISLYVFDDSGGTQTFASTLGEPLLTSQDINQAKNNDEASFTVKVGDKEFAVLAKTIEDFSGETIGVISIARDRAKFMALYNQAALTVLVVCLVAFAGVIILARFIAVSISGPINDAATAMMGIAEGDGDLTQRLPVKGQDEVAMMSSGFNLFAQKVQKSLITVTESTNVLSSSAEEMSYITQETRDGVRIQQNETEQVATAMNQMTTTVQEVAQNATEASTFAKNADAQAEQGQSIVNQAIQTIVALADDINRAVEVVSKVEKDSEKIGSVVDVIRGIAEQTNLLALNAAIEAARAGEQGRGFAVVADEVRTLASRTQSSTQEIESMIEQLQIGTREAASAMNNSKDASQNSVVHAEKAGVALEEITKAVKSISDMNIQIATAAEEQGAVSEEINKNIVNINDIGNRSYEGTEQTHSASVQLTDLASKLQSLLAQFKLR